MSPAGEASRNDAQRWRPPGDARAHSRLGQYMDWLAAERGLAFHTYRALWEWSVTEVEQFWDTIWDYFGVRSQASPDRTLTTRSMPDQHWYDGARLNYAEHAMGFDEEPDGLALLGRSQSRPDLDLTFGDLQDQVARAQSALRALGVGRGDRVVAYLPNAPETVVALLATASLGAVWASCAIELGPRAVLDRFAQVEPVVMLTAGGYRYGAKEISRDREIEEIRRGLPTLRAVLDVEYGAWRVPGAGSWPDLVAAQAGGRPEFVPLPFEHPLVLLFSSGTTGKPKPIIHGHGGLLVEHLKNHALSWDLGPGDRMLWYTTTSWMMWNALVSSLLVGCAAVLVDGDPAHPDLGWQWRLAEQTGATFMGVSPGFVMACRKTGLRLDRAGLHRIRILGSAGAPLPPEGHAWLEEQLGDETQINLGSGGTDVCSALVQNNPLLPVRAGVISGRCLGVAAYAFDDEGEVVVGQLGELVITEPMPSMPVGFWGDADGSKLDAAYFAHFPGVWRHGDWFAFEPDGSCRVVGRSDATLNRGGVRMGTAEFYRVVEEIDGVADSLVVHLEDAVGGPGLLILYVVTEPGADLDDLAPTISQRLRTDLSPRHVPDQITEVPAIPRNLVGKKLELPVKRILQGASVADVASRDSLATPGSLDHFTQPDG